MEGKLGASISLTKKLIIALEKNHLRKIHQPFCVLKI